MDDIKKITERLIHFRDQRDWKQFHSSKDLALAISIEASELNEVFLWKDSEDGNIEDIKEELADIFAYCFLLAHKHDLNVKDIIFKKIEKNELKYPIDKSKGSAKKYTDL